jgi:amino acid transporter
MPIAIFGSLALATVLYMLVVLVSVSAVAPNRLAESSAPLSLVLQNISSIDPRTISIIGMTAALNGIIVQIIMGSRMLYGMAGQGWVSKRFLSVNPKHHTPTTATIFVGGLMVAGTVLLPLVSLAQATSYLVLLIFCLVNISLVVLKLQKKPGKDIVQVPMALPVLGAISTISVILYQISVQ